MKTYLDCIPCFIRQALEAARMVTDDSVRCPSQSQCLDCSIKKESC